MATSRLTVRTLGLATVALILACGHAARAMNQQQQRGPDKPVTKAPSAAGRIIRVVPAGSSHSTIATYTASSGSGVSKVATFTSKSGTSGNTVVTFSGDKVVRAASASAPSRPNLQQNRRPSNSGSKLDPALVAVRKPGDAPALPPATPALTQNPAPAPAIKPSPAPAPIQVAQKPAALAAAPATDSRKAPARIRNAFGGLGGSRNLGSAMHSQGPYAQIQPR